jgi:type IV pilus assembly protein PilC
MIEQRQEMTRAVRSALTYPVLVVVALVVAIAFLVTFVVPRFAKMFMERGVELPALTRMLMAVGESVQGYWWAYLGVLIAGAIATKAAWGSPSFRLRADRVVARIPYVSRVLRGLALTRFSSVFGLSLGSGLGLIDSLELGGRAAGRPLLMRDARMLIDQVRKGGRLAEVLRDAEYLPPFARQLMSAGEQSAELRRMCDVISRHYARETSHLVKNAATVVEPVLIAGLTMVVLVVALAIFLPMWDMVTLVG